jgi:hypothetical protein
MLTVIHLITIPVDNTSVNPARSLATAVFQGGWALRQLWVFILFPIVGGVIGALAWRVLVPPADDVVGPAVVEPEIHTEKGQLRDPGIGRDPGPATA